MTPRSLMIGFAVVVAMCLIGLMWPIDDSITTLKKGEWVCSRTLLSGQCVEYQAEGPQALED